jgi:hypothetical protein
MAASHKVERLAELGDLNGPLPSYSELPAIPELGMRHCWGLFGDTDELGCMNLLTPERVARACGSVNVGVRVPLSLPLNEPRPAHGQRKQYVHNPIQSRNSRDDYLDKFYLQASSQWDSFRHIRAREFGWYNGFDTEVIDTDGPSRRLGIDNIGKIGVFARGVLADVRKIRRDEGRSADPFQGSYISVEELVHVLEVQGSPLETGDVLLVRTGWLGEFGKLSSDEAAEVMHSRDWLGLDSGEDMAEYLWNAHIAAVCADNVAVEFGPGDPVKGFLHRRILALMGVMIGEFWALEELGSACSTYGRYDFLCASIPLRLPGGVGSPANAVAIF